MNAIRRPHPRTTVLATLAGMLLFSLFCSSSIRYGHADAAIAATAAEVDPVAVGEPAPRFIVQTVEGDAFDFDPRKLERPAIIITFRGGWCPYCNMHLSELRHVVPQIRESDVDVLFLSGDRPDQIYTSLKADTQDDVAEADYRILSDADANAAIALGIAFRASDRTINRRKERGDDIDGSSMSNHGVLPVPAVFAVDRSGTVAFAFVEADYKVRLPADDLLAVARDLATD